MGVTPGIFKEDAIKRRPKPLYCYYCMKEWVEKGSKPEDKPLAIFPAEYNDKCPHCGANFKNYIVV